MIFEHLWSLPQTQANPEWLELLGPITRSPDRPRELGPRRRQKLVPHLGAVGRAALRTRFRERRRLSGAFCAVGRRSPHLGLSIAGTLEAVYRIGAWNLRKQYRLSDGMLRAYYQRLDTRIFWYLPGGWEEAHVFITTTLIAVQRLDPNAQSY